MRVGAGVNFEELARSTDEFNGAQLKAVCVEAGMIALRDGASELNHEHFHSGIAEGSLPRMYEPLLMACSSSKQEEERPDVFCLVYVSAIQTLRFHVYFLIMP